MATNIKFLEELSRNLSVLVKMAAQPPTSYENEAEMISVNGQHKPKAEGTEIMRVEEPSEDSVLAFPPVLHALPDSTMLPSLWIFVNTVQREVYIFGSSPY